MESRRVLIVSYYFPPSGGSGVQRTLKFVKYLPDFGWQPVVLTVDPAFAAYPDLDAGMPAEVQAGVEVIRTKSWDPYRLYAGWTGKTLEEAVTVGFLSAKPPSLRERFARWVRANLFVPDARIGWTPYALSAAKRRLADNDIAAIVTTGPPHSTHLIGRSLRRRSAIPWIADFRDPWTEIDFMGQLPMMKLAKRFNDRLESSVLKESTAVVAVSPGMREAYSARTDARCVTIYNGFDEADFEGRRTEAPSDSFVISHIGNMNAARNPEPLWQVLEDLVQDGSMPEVKVRLIGNVDGSILQRIRASILDAVVEKVDYLPHLEAVECMVASSMLLLPINRVRSASGIVTGKLFEYLAAQRPILGWGPAEGEAAQILRETGAGVMYDYEDTAGIEDFIMRAYRAWKHHQAFHEADLDVVARYSRRGQAGLLAGLLNELTDG